jgi:hypothetical protein
MIPTARDITVGLLALLPRALCSNMVVECKKCDDLPEEAVNQKWLALSRQQPLLELTVLRTSQ